MLISTVVLCRQKLQAFEVARYSAQRPPVLAFLFCCSAAAYRCVHCYLTRALALSHPGDSAGIYHDERTVAGRL